jgi:hypothetical protein
MSRANTISPGDCQNRCAGSARSAYSFTSSSKRPGLRDRSCNGRSQRQLQPLERALASGVGTQCERAEESFGDVDGQREDGK